MVQILGNIWWQNLINSVQQKDFIILDDTFINNANYQFHIPPLLKEIICSRASLRSWCSNNKYLQPAWTVVKKLEDATSWINKLNKLPVCIKSVYNYSNSYLTYKIESYKNLLEYFELLESYQTHEVLLEEWIDSNIFLEITICQGKIVFVTKQQLAKSLEIRVDSRILPIILPDFVKQFVEELIYHLNLENLTSNYIVRLTLAVKNYKCILISISMAYNRIEYLSCFSEFLNLPPLLQCNKSSKDKQCINKPSIKNTYNLGKIKFYYTPNKKISFPKFEISNLYKLGVVNYYSEANNAVALFIGNSIEEINKNVISFTRLLEEEITKNI